jgi:hypothetical protein
MVQLLLGYDADLEAEHEGLRPQALAAQREHTETAAVLQKAADRRAQRKASSGNASVRRDPEAAVEPEVGLEAGYEAAAAAAAAAAAVAAQKKRLKRERQKSKAAASAEAQAVQEAAAAEFGAAESKAAAAAAAAAAAEEAEEMHVSSPPPSLVERRADALLAERALAEMSVEVAKKERFAAAVEGVAVAKEKSAAKDAVSERLQHLSMGAAKKDQGDRLTAAVEEVAAQKGQAGTTGRER